MKLIVNVRGTNGSGKSTLPRTLTDDPKMFVVIKPYKGKPVKIATVFPSYGWVALGTYFCKTGGLDGFKDSEITKKAFWYVLKKYPQYHLIMEGIISSTIFSTYFELFKAAESLYPDRKTVVLWLNPDVGICLDRIQQRNGGKPIKEELVRNKARTIARACAKFKDRGIEVISWDNSKYKLPVKLKLYPDLATLIRLSRKPF